MKLTLLVISLLGLVALGAAANLRSSRQAKIVEKINSMNGGFKARMYKEYEGLSFEQLKARYATPIKPEDRVQKPVVLKKNDGGSKTDASGLTNFNIWQKWNTYNDTFLKVQPLGNCKGSWATSVSAAYRDRFAIVRGQTEEISGWDILSCAANSVDPKDGCNGGKHTDAFQYVINNGTVSGDYISPTGCVPWPLDPSAPAPTSTQCVQKCVDGNQVPYQRQKLFGDGMRTFYGDTKGVMNEILDNGSVVARFELFEDFLNYENGVYSYMYGRSLGFVYVRVVGWGVSKENDTPYWRAAFLNGKDWGENGFFRISRNSNECDFESAIIAGSVV